MIVFIFCAYQNFSLKNKFLTVDKLRYLRQVYSASDLGKVARPRGFAR